MYPQADSKYSNLYSSPFPLIPKPGMVRPPPAPPPPPPPATLQQIRANSKALPALPPPRLLTLVV